MGIFGSVSGKQVDDFAVTLARELAEQCPPPAASAAQRSQASPRKLASTLQAIFDKALHFKSQHRLGVYKKARLGNSFRWELTSLGYEKKVAEDFTQRLIVHIARKK